MFKGKTFFTKRIVGIAAAMAVTLSMGTAIITNSCKAEAAMDYSELGSGYSYSTNMRGWSAQQIAADMGAGWNLGNSLESENNETYWGNPKTTKAMIDKIAEKGYKTLRIPVRWDDNYTDSNYTISSSYMDRVETVVNYGLANNMYVIINVHHNDLQTMVSYDGGTQWRVKNELSAIWTQIANRFKNYGDKLIFEVNNEPRCGEDWGGNSVYYDCVNQYNEAARSAIRATGGNNSSRLVLLPTYCASADSEKLYGWKNLSNDKMIAVSIHAYKPFDFAYEGNGHSNWTNDDYNSLAATFSELNSVFISKGIAVVIGEFGATEKNNYNDRVKYAEVYASLAKSYGIPCLWWDNNCTGYGAEKFGIFDRNSYSFTYGGIADAMIGVYGRNDPSSGGSSSDGNNSGSDTANGYVSLFYGNSSASNWGQAVETATVNCGGSFNASNIKKGGHFYVEYDGNEGELELILQSFNGGAGWAKVAISETGYANGHKFAKFSYDNCVSAFGTEDFSGKLDKIYVGSTASRITVYSVCYDFGSQSGNADTEDSGNHEVKPADPSQGDPYISLFWGENYCGAWKQAASVMTAKNGGSFNPNEISSNGYFYIEYSGDENQVELILQSWSGGANWAKASASETGYANGHRYSKFSYQSIINAFGGDFSKLDQIHAGAMSSGITVYSMCYCTH